MQVFFPHSSGISRATTQSVLSNLLPDRRQLRQFRVRQMPFSEGRMAQRQFAFGAGLDLPWSAFLIRPSNPNQRNQMVLADDLFRFSRKNERVPGENMRAVLWIGLVRFDVPETQ